MAAAAILDFQKFEILMVSPLSSERLTRRSWRSWRNWKKHLKALTDGCNLFLEREIRCEEHTKHPYHVRGLNSVRSKCKTQSGASPHQLSFFGVKFQPIGWQPLADRGNALFQSAGRRNYRWCRSERIVGCRRRMLYTTSRQTLRRGQLAPPCIR